MPVAFTPSFTDVRRSDWYAPALELAARRAWVHGYNDCYGASFCQVKPAAFVTRAEASAMLVRYLGVMPLDLAPPFSDMVRNAWYGEPVRSAADRCLVMGDAATGRLEPDRPVTRGEWAVMLYRSEQSLRYGRDCVQ
jgi:hypothetical protein